jgi:hypothetical protein
VLLLLLPQDAASRNAMAGQEGVSQELGAAQARMKLLEASLAEAHATVRGPQQAVVRWMVQDVIQVTCLSLWLC